MRILTAHQPGGWNLEMEMPAVLMTSLEPAAQEDESESYIGLWSVIILSLLFALLKISLFKSLFILP